MSLEAKGQVITYLGLAAAALLTLGAAKCDQSRCITVKLENETIKCCPDGGILRCTRPEPEPVPTPEPTAVPTPQPTAEPTPASTPEPTPEPTPQPSATPVSCPDLVCWHAQIHNVMNKYFQPVSKPEREGYVVIDSTPLFERCGAGGRCNGEFNRVCGGRACEDPRGGVWTLHKGNAPMRVQAPGPDTGFQVRLGPLDQGVYKVCVTPRPDAADELGKPHTVRGRVEGCVEFEVE